MSLQRQRYISSMVVFPIGTSRSARNIMRFLLFIAYIHLAAYIFQLLFQLNGICLRSARGHDDGVQQIQQFVPGVGVHLISFFLWQLR